jgi:ABC-2 type transport system permease protein
MLADAFASENYKFLRNRSAVFWGFCFVPLAVLAFNLALDSWMKLHNAGALTLRIDLGQQILQSVDLGGSSFVQIFFAAGAAALFAGEYRWETWRLLCPRNSRSNLMAAKFLVYALACAVSLMALGIVAALHTGYDASINGQSLTLPGIGFVTPLAVTFLASWAELLVLGGVTALVAVIMRASTGALMTAIFFSFAQTVGMAFVHPWSAPLKDFAFLPSMCAYLIRAWAAGQEIAPGVLADPAMIAPVSLFLVGWIVALTALVLALFRFQDLPRE